MESFRKQVDDKKRCWEPKRKTVFCIEASSPTISKELSDMLGHKNVKKSNFYVAFYNNAVASSCYNLLEHVV